MSTQSKLAQNPLLRSYMARLQKNPLQTKMVTAGIFMALGEVLAGNLSGMTTLQQTRWQQGHGGRVSSSPIVHLQEVLIAKGFNGRALKMFL